MRFLYRWTDEQMASAAVPPGIVFVSLNGLCLCDAPHAYGPHKARLERSRDDAGQPVEALGRTGCFPADG